MISREFRVSFRTKAELEGRGAKESFYHLDLVWIQDRVENHQLSMSIDGVKSFAEVNA